jgi:putative oxidoreductase
MVALGLLLVRVVVGVLFIGHGAQKLFGWFGGYGPKGTGGWLDSVGIKPGVFMAVLAGLMELVGGVLFAAGLFTLIAGILIALVMVGTFKIHGKNGVWATANGYEYQLVLLVTGVGIALIGAGEYSLDALIK